MTINKNLLTQKMREKEITMAQLSEAMGMHRATLFRKLANGGGELSLNDVIAIETTLGLNKNESISIFLG